MKVSQRLSRKWLTLCPAWSEIYFLFCDHNIIFIVLKTEDLSVHFFITRRLDPPFLMSQDSLIPNNLFWMFKYPMIWRIWILLHNWVHFTTKFESSYWVWRYRHQKVPQEVFLPSIADTKTTIFRTLSGVIVIQGGWLHC